MKKVFCLIFTTVLLLANISSSMQTETFFSQKSTKQIEVVSNSVLVKYKKGISSLDIESKNIKITSSIPKINVYEVKPPEGETIKSFIEKLKKDPSVEYAEPNQVIRAFSTTPNDPSYSLQWGLPLISAPEAWDSSKGSSDVIVANIDSGIDYNHPDLTNKIWKNPIEDIPANRNNGIDDDSNGFVDDYQGWNFYNNNNDPDDVNGHGSHTAGIIAAETDNSIGVAGLSWRSQLMAIRIMSPAGMSSDSELANGIIYAVDNGSKIINLSLGGDEPSDTMKTAIDYAYDNGCVIVAAAGNEGGAVSYPAAYPNVVAVTAVDEFKKVTSYSNRGPEVDVCAPGGLEMKQIYSTVYNSEYGYKYGTSMATPYVSGLAALILSKYPSLDNKKIIYLITSEAEDLSGKGRDDYYGYGLINAKNSIVDIKPPTVTVQQPTTGQSFEKNGTLIIAWNAYDSGIGLAPNPISIFYSTNEGTTYTPIALSLNNSGSYSWTIPDTSTNSGKIKVTAVDIAGNIGIGISGTFIIIDRSKIITAYPIPVKLGDSLNFSNLSGRETIRIFDSSGETVKTIHNDSNLKTVSWDTKNEKGGLCANGIYFYIISFENNINKKGKFIISR